MFINIGDSNYESSHRDVYNSKSKTFAYKLLLNYFFKLLTIYLNKTSNQEKSQDIEGLKLINLEHFLHLEGQNLVWAKLYYQYIYILLIYHL